jgi:hypothetical protein
LELFVSNIFGNLQFHGYVIFFRFFSGFAEPFGRFETDLCQVDIPDHSRPDQGAKRFVVGRSAQQRATKNIHGLRGYVG